MSCGDVVELVVKKGLCIGCGVCVSQCSNKSLFMKMNVNGFYEVEKKFECDCGGGCLDVCPFNPFPKNEIKTENEISEIFLSEAAQYNNKIGRYENTYVGFSNEFRETSSSGGIATYVLTKLLEQKKVDFIISVIASSRPGISYEYKIVNNKEDVLKTSKTKYFPVTMADVVQSIKMLDGNVAIVGVACFIKGIRLLQNKDSLVNDKVKFIIGIICGGVKSTYFSEYLASASGAINGKYYNPEFRIKDITSQSSDYSFGCLDENKKQKVIKMSTLGDMWGTGLFKAKACDYCDDVTTELADISLGDAWLEPYLLDGKGNNIIITRSKHADYIINEGVKSGELSIDTISVQNVIASQQGSFNHRHEGIAYRLMKAKSLGEILPPKRFEKDESSFIFKLIQIMRMRTREKSIMVWNENKNHIDFNRKMKFDLTILKALTKVNKLYKKTVKSLGGGK
jgi:coenzyme F420-reducing hydrogenase beta subunit